MSAHVNVFCLVGAVLVLHQFENAGLHMASESHGEQRMHAQIKACYRGRQSPELESRSILSSLIGLQIIEALNNVKKPGLVGTEL